MEDDHFNLGSSFEGLILGGSWCFFLQMSTFELLEDEWRNILMSNPATKRLAPYASAIDQHEKYSVKHLAWVAWNDGMRPWASCMREGEGLADLQKQPDRGAPRPKSRIARRRSPTRHRSRSVSARGARKRSPTACCSRGGGRDDPPPLADSRDRSPRGSVQDALDRSDPTVSAGHPLHSR